MIMQVSKMFIAMVAVSLICFEGRSQEKQEEAIIVVGRYQGSQPVSGLVKDASTGLPLRGIRITYKEVAAAITDSTGAFKINLPSLNLTLLVEGDGYQAKEIALRGRNNVTTSLYEDTYSSFYDQAAHPFGNVLKSRSPFAITSVQTNGNWARTNETPATYLQGKVSGLNATRRSGTPNMGATMFLRGISSLYASNQPLIVVDGVIFNNQDHGGSIISNHYTEPLSTIDPRDIDNITVIKDGSSIYGTKGSNGVIIITTARARELGTKIDFSAYGGVNLAPSNIPVLDAANYRIYLSELLKSKGLTDAAIMALPYMNDDNTQPEYFKYHNNTDWQKEVFKQGSTKNIYLKVTGGDNIAKYALSLGYMGNDGITRNTDLTRYNMRFNGDLNLSRRMTATTNLSFTFNEQNVRDQGVSPKTNPIFLALTKSPLLRIRDVSEKGVESPTFADRDTFGIGNPAVLTNVALGINKSYRFLGSIGFNYTLSKNFILSTTVGVTNDKVRENFFIPRKGVAEDTLTTDIADSRSGTQVNSLFSLYNDTRLTFNKTIRGLHDVSSRIGVRYLYNRIEQDFGLGFNSAIDELVSVGNGVNALRRIGGSIGESNWLSTYFNADYTYSDKYILSLNVAVDGSSRFGKNIQQNALTISGNKFAVMPSIAAAWLISSENFLKGGNIDLLKLRASYSMTGNDDIGNYTARQTYVPQNLLGVQGLVRSGFGNDQLQWESVRKVNVGTDVSIFNERVSFSFDVYQNNIDKMIVYEPTPTASGFSYAITNSAGMTTNGIDASLNARIIGKAALKWDVGFTLGTYTSTIDGLPTTRIISSFAGAEYITQKGGSPNEFYGYKTNGVYATDNEAAQAGLTVKKSDGSFTPFTGGDVRFVDVNSDGVIDANDKQVIGDPNPDMFGSFNTRVEYKRFALDALFTFVSGNDVFNYTRQQLESMSNFNNQTEAVLNRWRTNGHETNVPKATWGDPMGNSRFSDRWIEDGSYLRLRTVSLSYNIPFKAGFLKYAVAYLTGNNLVTLTKYKGYDPEFSPTESIFGQGVDNTLEPQSRSVILGVRFGL
ncbi:MAG: SusC/RagA family TonB-linked outer membrane protein [Chitinophagaceae bacterium]|nr:SusC/RagA family TonB-linked outer membrane protein [Chitinophagaceae bacterium]